MRIAIMEDNEDMGAALAHWLEMAGHSVKLFSGGKAFMKAVSRDSFELFILDWEVPETTGLDILVWLRSTRQLETPVLFVTARNAEEDIVNALRMGADDYMVKPVRKNELLARVEVLARRSGMSMTDEAALACGKCKLLLKDRRALVGGRQIDLADREFDLAVFMMQNAGKVLSRGHIIERVWGIGASIETRTVDTHMSRLRKKLLWLPEHGVRLVSMYSFGYRLECHHANPDAADGSY